MTNVPVPRQVPEGKETDYRGQYGKCIQKKFSGFDEKSKRENLRESIETEQNHRKLISYSIFPFAESSPAGYKFITVEPLEEIGVSNVDFLLYDMDGHAIFGEAKSSIPSNTDRVVNQLSERREKVNDNLDYIEETYLGDKITHAEFVLVTYIQHSEEIAKRIAERGEKIITWAVDPTSDILLIKQARPSSFPDNLEATAPDEMLAELDRRHSHSVHELNSELNRRTTSLGQADILPTAIIVDRLRVVIQARKVVGRHPCVNKEDIVEVVQNSILNYADSRIREMVENIIQAGKRINFLSDWDREGADLKIVTNYTSRDDIEKVLMNKYVDYRVERMKDRMREECKEEILSNFDKQTQIDDFQS
jgi:hypothetical protein